MSDIAPILCSFDSDFSTNLKTPVDPHNSNSPAFGSASRNEPLDLSSGKNLDRVFGSVAQEPFSVLKFLRNLLVEELGNDKGLDHKLIVFAIHAVLLESGFVAFDPIGNRVIDGFHFREIWSTLLQMSPCYTRPEIITASRGNTIESIALKFQSFGKFINVYGSLSGSDSGALRVITLDEEQLVPPLNVVWANCIANENTSAGKEVLMFWRDVKDNFALPLLTDIYEKVGFDLPPCFMKLPSELKLKIIEKLRGVDVANVSCVCSELNGLAQSDDLWKLKFVEEFQSCTDEFQGSWKKAYVRKWEKQGEMKKSPLPSPDPICVYDDDVMTKERFLRKLASKKRKHLRLENLVFDDDFDDEYEI